MATEIRNQGSQLASGLMKPQAKSGSDSAVVGAGFQELYKSMDAPRKNPSQMGNDSGGDIKKAVDNINEAMDFSTKLLLASAKNMGMPSEDGGDNKSQEMTQMAQGIASMMATKAQVQAQMQAIEQQKKPAIDLMSLKGKQVEYNDSSRDFYGEDVSYNYKVSHTEQDPTASVNLTLTIRDERGIAIKTVRQAGKVGESSYKWNGQNESGHLMPPGSYTLDVKADGRKIVGGVSIPFPVTASATLVGEVEGVKIENGTAIGVVINGNVVARDNISDVRDMPEPELEVPLTPDLIGRKVELDFSKAKVQPDGSMEVYFKNHVEKPGDLTVQVYDKSGKYLTSATSKDTIGVGVGKVSFSQMDLDPGVYDIQVFVQDIENPDSIKDVELSYGESILVAGVSNRYGTLMSVDETTYDPIHVTSVLGNYTTPIEQRRAELAGSQIIHRDDLFKFAVGDETSFTFKRPEGGAIISHGRMDMYDVDSGELLTSIKAEYRPYDLLNERSKGATENYMNQNFRLANYNNLTTEQRLQTNRFIESGLEKEDADDTALRMLDEHKEAYDKGQSVLSFPAWDGRISDGSMVDSSKQLRRDYTPIYSRDHDQSVYAGDTDKAVVIASVEHVDEVEGELELYLTGGSVISEALVLSSRKL